MTYYATWRDEADAVRELCGARYVLLGRDVSPRPENDYYIGGWPCAVTVRQRIVYGECDREGRIPQVRRALTDILRYGAERLDEVERLGGWDAIEALLRAARDSAPGGG